MGYEMRPQDCGLGEVGDASGKSVAPGVAVRSRRSEWEGATGPPSMKGSAVVGSSVRGRSVTGRVVDVVLLTRQTRRRIADGQRCLARL